AGLRPRAQHWRSWRCLRSARFRRRCEMDLQFLLSALSNAVGSFAAGLGVVVVCCVSKKLCRAIIRWRTSKFPKGPDARRAQEELQGIVEELDAAERMQLVAQILLRPALLRREIAARVAERH